MVMLLPADSLDESTEIVVKRQLLRGFGLEEDKERIKFAKRYPIYKELGDIKIFSSEAPETIAEKMKKEIGKYLTEEARKAGFSLASDCLR